MTTIAFKEEFPIGTRCLVKRGFCLQDKEYPATTVSAVIEDLKSDVVVIKFEEDGETFPYFYHQIDDLVKLGDSPFPDRKGNNLYKWYSWFVLRSKRAPEAEEFEKYIHIIAVHDPYNLEISLQDCEQFLSRSADIAEMERRLL